MPIFGGALNARFIVDLLSLAVVQVVVASPIGANHTLVNRRDDDTSPVCPDTPLHDIV